MAMTALAPAITRSKEIFVEKTSQVALKLVPNVSDGKQADRKFFAIFVSIVGGIGQNWSVMNAKQLLARLTSSLPQKLLQNLQQH
jgi:hypothetical protein